MKKLIIALIIVCLLMAGLYTYLKIDENKKAAEAPSAPEITDIVAQPAAEDDAAAEPVEEASGADAEEAPSAPEVKSIDYDALKASIDADEVVMTVNGNEVTWGEYYYWLNYWTQYAEYYMTMYSYYGMETSWEEYAEPVKQYAQDQIVALYSLEDVAAENEVELTEEQLQSIEDDIKKSVEGEYDEATEENINAYFENRGVTVDTYKRLARADLFYKSVFNTLYGENGEKVSDEEVAAWLEENEYMYATHILLATSDLATGEALDEETVAAKQAQAEELVNQLRKIKKPDKRLEKFNELKAELCEDTGKEQYPDGYVFKAGDMVEEFENGYLSSEKDFDVTDPILTSFGYHIIMKLPLNPDAVMSYSDDGTALTARATFANEAYAKLMDERCENADVVVFDCIKNLNILDYLK